MAAHLVRLTALDLVSIPRPIPTIVDSAAIDATHQMARPAKTACVCAQLVCLAAVDNVLIPRLIPTIVDHIARDVQQVSSVLTAYAAAGLLQSRNQ